MRAYTLSFGVSFFLFGLLVVVVVLLVRGFPFFYQVNIEYSSTILRDSSVTQDTAL